MTKDNDIKQLFDTFTPEKEGDVEFMLQLKKKMQVVDVVRGEHGRVAHFYKGLAIGCFLLGLMLGLSLLSVVMLHPFDWSQLTEIAYLQYLSPKFVLFCSQHADMILNLTAAFVIIASACPLLLSDPEPTLSKLHLTREV